MKNGFLIRKECPVCKSSFSESIFKRSFNEPLLKDYIEQGYNGKANIQILEDITFEIVKCSNCNLSFQKYVFDEVLLNELYNNWIDPKLAEKWNEDKKDLSRQLYSFILNFTKRYFGNRTSPIKVLDFGAGFGDSLVLAKEMGFDAYAYEYSEERIQFLEDKGIKVIDQNNDILFDLVIVNQVLEHLTNPKEIMNFLISKLAKNGLIYISVPNCPQLKQNLKDVNKISDVSEFKKKLLDNHVVAFQHINFFSNNNLKQFLEGLGLKRINPFCQLILRPLSFRYLILPFYNHYLRTTFFLKR